MQPVKRSSTTASSCLISFIGIVFILTSCGGLLFFVPELKGNYTVANLLSGANLGGLIGGAVFGLAFFVVGAIMLIAGRLSFICPGNKTDNFAPQWHFSSQRS